MPEEKIPALGIPATAPRAVEDRSAAESLSAVNKRLAEAEHQLGVQFTRIAQLQAQLDLVLAALRRVTEGRHKR
jgi:hypothetical protein